MFNKSTLFFFALVASGAVGAPIRERADKITTNFKPGTNDLPAAASAPAPAAPALAATGPCNATDVQSTISQMKDVANQILSVGLVAPDPFRQSDASAATFDQVVSAINDAGTAAASGDFATVSSKLSFIDDTVNGLLSGLDVQDGLDPPLRPLRRRRPPLHETTTRTQVFAMRRVWKATSAR
ncbi:hypothetical protein B0H10DRAFT_1420401 [Mycena sp. CBHHK59/15]|nr:hypothetical protein B0H10DRAFT_1420401 [Mycena sp. CBHHK59/15]